MNSRVKDVSVKSNRDASTECYRVALMFGIVLLHTITQCGFCRRGLDNVLSTCVDSFVFISGYYGIRFTFSKVVRLVSIGIFCAAVVSLCSGLGIRGIVPTLVKNGCYWFLWTYIAIMMCSSIINAGVDVLLQVNGLRSVIPFVVLVFGWSYMTIVPHVNELVPSVNGFGSIGMLSMLGTYIVARIYNITLEKRIDSSITLCIIAIACLPFIVIGFYHHNSPFTIMFVTCCFSLVRKIRVPSYVSSVSSFIVPSLFSVYLLHANSLGFGIMRRGMVKLVEENSFPLYLSYISVALVAFVCCFFIDLLRRWVCFLGRIILVKVS